MKCRWHHAHGEFLDVEVVEPYAKQSDVPDGKQMADPVIIAFGGEMVCVPAHQLYGLERPPRPEAIASAAKSERRSRRQPAQQSPSGVTVLPLGDQTDTGDDNDEPDKTVRV